MNGGNENTQMLYHLNTGVSYGTIGLTNEKLVSSDQVVSFASRVVPEPATATLSLLAWLLAAAASKLLLLSY